MSEKLTSKEEAQVWDAVYKEEMSAEKEGRQSKHKEVFYREIANIVVNKMASERTLH